MSENKTEHSKMAMLVVLSAVKAILAQSQDAASGGISKDAVSSCVSATRFSEVADADRVVDLGLENLTRTHPELAGPDPIAAIVKAMTKVGGSELAKALRADAKAGDELQDGIVAEIARADAANATGPVMAMSTSAAPSGDDHEDDEAPAPFNASLINETVTKSMGMLIAKATSNQIPDAMTLFKRLEKAEATVSEYKASKRAHRAAVETGSVQDSQGAVIWTSERVQLGKILDPSDVGGSGIAIPKLMQREVKVWSCNARHPAVPRIDPNYVFDAAALAKALYAIDAGENLAFVGPPGCGKTTITKQLAARLGRPFYRIPIDGEMRRTEIIGGFKQVADVNGSRTQWFDGLLTKGISEPSIIDLDEIDRGDPDLLYAAHAVLEREGIAILEDAGRHVPMHPDCVILATANTKGRADANGLYASVNEMSVATHDRIPFWHDCDYQSESDEAAMLVRKVPGLSAEDAKKIAQLAAGLRLAFKNGQLRTSFSARQTIAAGRYAVSLMNSGLTRFALKEAISSVFESRAVDSADETTIKEAIGMMGI